MDNVCKKMDLNGLQAPHMGPHNSRNGNCRPIPAISLPSRYGQLCHLSIFHVLEVFLLHIQRDFDSSLNLCKRDVSDQHLHISVRGQTRPSKPDITGHRVLEKGPCMPDCYLFLAMFPCMFPASFGRPFRNS